MLLAVSQTLDIQSDCIPRIATGFGGGIGRQGEVCGTLSGGVMVIGLVHGRQHRDDKEAKNLTYALASEFIRQFALHNGNVRCRELLDLEIRDEDAVQIYRARNLKKEVCFNVVSNAIRDVMEILADEDLAAS